MKAAADSLRYIFPAVWQSQYEMIGLNGNVTFELENINCKQLVGKGWEFVYNKTLAANVKLINAGKRDWEKATLPPWILKFNLCILIF